MSRGAVPPTGDRPATPATTEYLRRAAALALVFPVDTVGHKSERVALSAMSDTDAVDTDLHQRAQALLEPGEIELVGMIVHTDISGDQEPTLHEATLEIGDHIADHSGLDPGDTYVYSGNDDPDFGVNQHQGLTLAGDEFVWECQQLLREGTFDVVFYYEADVDQAALVESVREAGYDAVGVEPA